MLRVLHTSDWHLGSSVEGFLSRDDDHRAFLAWLVATVEERHADVLVVAGDVFDHAQPSAEAQRLYYGFLARLASTPLRKVVIVGGNHDSAARLDAPRDLLSGLDIHVVGGVTADEASWDRALCPVPRRRGAPLADPPDAMVLAVPFVHEFALGFKEPGVAPYESAAQLAKRFRARYAALCDKATARAAGAPLLATGHLACSGYVEGDAPFDVHQVGRIGALPPSIFDERLAYVALGHLHRCFRVEQSRAWYPGSPIPLTVAESAAPRHVLLAELDGATNEPVVTPLAVPVSRRLVELSGSLGEVRDQLASLQWDTPRPPIVRVKVEVDSYQAGVEDLVRKTHTAGAEQPTFASIRQSQRAAVEAGGAPAPKLLADLTPAELFERLCHERQEPLTPELREAFASLVAEVASEGGAA